MAYCHLLSLNYIFKRINALYIIILLVEMKELIYFRNA